MPLINYKRGTARYTEKEQKHSDGHKQAKWVAANEEVVRSWREKHENPDRIHEKRYKPQPEFGNVVSHLEYLRYIRNFGVQFCRNRI